VHAASLSDKYLIYDNLLQSDDAARAARRLRCRVDHHHQHSPPRAIRSKETTNSHRHTFAASALQFTCLGEARPAILPKEALLIRAEIILLAVALLDQSFAGV